MMVRRTLLTLTQIAEKVGVDRRTAMRWSKLPDWPPVAEIRNVWGNDARCYEWAEVERLLIDTHRWDQMIQRPTGFEPGDKGSVKRSVSRGVRTINRRYGNHE